MKKMKKSTKVALSITLLLAVCLAIGVTVYLLTRKPAHNAPADGGDSHQSANIDLTKTFKPVSIIKLQRVETYTTKLSTGATYTTVSEYDGKGNYKSTHHSTGDPLSNTSSESYAVNGAYYECQAGKCKKTTDLQKTTFNANERNEAAKEIQKFTDSMKYVGKKDCTAGKCFVWETDKQKNAGGSPMVYYLDDKARVVKIESLTNSADKIIFEYQYKSVPEIKAPQV